MKVRNIGECFKYGERTLEVVESDTTCKGCCFRGLSCCTGILKKTGACSPSGRGDDKFVVFKEVKKL